MIQPIEAVLGVRARAMLRRSMVVLGLAALGVASHASTASAYVVLCQTDWLEVPFASQPCGNSDVPALYAVFDSRSSTAPGSGTGPSVTLLANYSDAPSFGTQDLQYWCIVEGLTDQPHIGALTQIRVDGAGSSGTTTIYGTDPNGASFEARLTRARLTCGTYDPFPPGTVIPPPPPPPPDPIPAD